MVCTIRPVFDLEKTDLQWNVFLKSTRAFSLVCKKKKNATSGKAYRPNQNIVNAITVHKKGLGCYVS